MWTCQYIISQICVLFAVIFFSATYLTKKHGLVLLFSSAAALFYGLEYLLLGSFTGFVINLIAIFRGLWFFLDEKFKVKWRWVSLLAIEIAIIVLGIITWSSVSLSLLPVLANLIFTYALWQKNNKIYRVLSLINSLIWITFNVVLLSVLGIVTEIIILIVEILGLIVYH